MGDEDDGQPVEIRAQGRPDGVRLPVIGGPPQPGRSHSGVGVRWIEEGALLAVTTWGSSSHPLVPRTARLDGGELVLTFARRGIATGPMTADLAAYTSLIEPPAGLAPGAPTRVRIGDRVLDLLPSGTA